MAAAEARTAWQRMANRYFVQEDAKRAPMFACCPSSASKMQNDSSNMDGKNEKDHPALNFAHLNWNPTNLNLPLDTKWWLQIQPNFGCRGVTREELNLSEGKLHKTEVLDAPFSDSEANNILVDERNASSVLEPPKIVSAKLSRRNSDSKLEGMKATTSTPELLKHKINFHEHWCEDECLIDRNADEQLVSGKRDNASFDLAPHWVSGEKTEPWWKIADREELASFVAKRSLEHFDNCDLPRPQKMQISRGAFHCYETFNEGGVASFSDDLNDGICSQSGHTAHSSVSRVDRSNMSYNEMDNPFSDSDVLLSHGYKSASDFKEKRERAISSGIPSKDELLEALCHSQTRAREAEIAAQKAYNEKEHVIKLFFKQASHLFAYKQWLRLLQLERLYLQLMIGEEQDPSTQPPHSPWKAEKEDMLGENRCKDGKRKGNEQHPCGICGFLVAFAVGFSLASAGMLLGWTLGCLLPV